MHEPDLDIEEPLQEDFTPAPDQGVGDLATGATVGLRVNSTPSGAAVLVDGVEQGQTPCAVADISPERIYLLSVRLSGHRPWSGLVDPSDGSALQLSPSLDPAPAADEVGHLQVNTPTPSELFIDGKLAGHVSSQGLLPLPPGEYEVALSHPKKARRPRHLVTIRAGEITVLVDNF